MFDIKLFLGVAADKALEEALARENPRMVSLFLGGDPYLSEMRYKKRRYLGKPVPLSSSISQLENLEKHLLSLLRKLAPDYPFSKNRPVLLTPVDDPSCN